MSDDPAGCVGAVLGPRLVASGAFFPPALGSKAIAHTGGTTSNTHTAPEVSQWKKNLCEIKG